METYKNTYENLNKDRIKELHRIPIKRITQKKHYKQYVKFAKKYLKTNDESFLNEAMSHYLKAHILGTPKKVPRKIKKMMKTKKKPKTYPRILSSKNIHTHSLQRQPWNNA